MTNRLAVPVKKLTEGAQLPSYQTPGAAGFDFHADVPEVLILAPNQMLAIGTGLAFAIPEGFELQVRPRSGLAFKNQITVLNTPGTVDSDFRGEVKVLLHNHGTEPFTVRPGDRIAQGIIAPVFQATFVANDDLPETTRGEGGFGSTGLAAVAA